MKPVVFKSEEMFAPRAGRQLVEVKSNIVVLLLLVTGWGAGALEISLDFLYVTGHLAVSFLGAVCCSLLIGWNPNMSSSSSS